MLGRVNYGLLGETNDCGEREGEVLSGGGLVVGNSLEVAQRERWSG